MFRFIHTSDWQLGMTRHYLNADAQARYDQARYDAIGAIGRLCRERDCRLVVVAGDLFESNLVRPAVVGRALEALRQVPVPVVILPGNHDPLDDASVYRGDVFASARPEHVHVLGQVESVEVDGGVTVVGHPWRSKHPAGNPFLDTLEGLPPADGRLRIGVAHGMVDEVAFQGESQAILPADRLASSLARGQLHYIALGDRHSFTRVAERVYYSGTPETTDFNEVDPGMVAMVELDGDAIRVDKAAVGQWQFQRRAADLTSREDVEAMIAALTTVTNKERTVVRLDLTGEIDFETEALLRDEQERLNHLFAGFDVRDNALGLRPDLDADLVDQYRGFLAGAARQLADRSRAGDATATDALLLLRRLVPADGGEA